jgi:putative hydrolase of HD superfamily
MMNLSTDGRTWKGQGIRKSEIIQINEVVKLEAPEIYGWMFNQIQEDVNKKWLINS